MPPRPVLYATPMSHYCVCAERALALKGIRHRTVRVPYHDKRALLAATRQDYVPALVWTDGRVVLWDELAGFLERERPEPRLFPEGRRGLAETLDNWAHLVLEERVWRAVVTRVPARLPDPLERWVFEEMQARARGPWPQLVARRAEFERELAPFLARVEMLLDGCDWVLGSPSLADTGIYGALAPLRFVGGTIPSRYPRTRAWSRRVAGLGPATRPPRDRRRTMK